MAAQAVRSSRFIVGLSTDEKPIDDLFQAATTTPVGSKFYEFDTRKTYIFDGTSKWYLFEEPGEAAEKLDELKLEITALRELVTLALS